MPALTSAAASLRRVFGAAVLEQLHLVELVAADRPALLRAVAARLFTITRRVGEVLLRQLRLVQDLVAVQVDERRLCGRQQEAALLIGAGLDHEHVVRELGELPCRVAARR
jgi:hypothetical protein